VTEELYTVRNSVTSAGLRMLLGRSNVARTGDATRVYRMSIGKAEGRNLLENLAVYGEHNMKLDLRGIAWGPWDYELKSCGS
jgi:hypothetical protein